MYSKIRKQEDCNLKTEELLFVNGSENPIGKAIDVLPLDENGMFYKVRCPSGEIKRIIDYSGDKYVLKTENARRM
jgi:hypothetical protein